MVAQTLESSYFDKGHIRQINSMSDISRKKSIVELMGENKLGFTRDDIGLHSIRSRGGGRAVFLPGVSEIIIERKGRWESFALLKYNIIEQVVTFTYGVSSSMLDNERFHHINEKNCKIE